MSSSNNSPSVEDLKQEKLFEGMYILQIENFRVVITKRFVGSKTGCFYLYGAGIYPFGPIGKIISFTPVLIEKVIHRGYEDDVDEEFVYQMKKHLVVEQKRKSAGFVSQEEAKELFRIFAKIGGTV